MRTRILSLGVVLWSAVAIATAQPAPGLLKGERLTFSARSPHRVAGTFVHEDVQLSFDSTRTNDGVTFTLRDRAERVVFRATSDMKTYSLEFYDGGLKATGVIPEVANAQSVRPCDLAPKGAGDIALATRFRNSPEFRTLPWLSRALAVNGVFGTEAPSSLYLHALALGSATANKIALPDIVALNAKVPNAAACADQRKDPCKNDCFGMCGPGCTCWKWVCGDCCMHVGCLTHDVTCRLCDCSIFNVGDCILCYTAISFLGAHPCTVIKGCQNPPKC